MSSNKLPISIAMNHLDIRVKFSVGSLITLKSSNWLLRLLLKYASDTNYTRLETPLKSSISIHSTVLLSRALIKDGKNFQLQFNLFISHFKI